MEEILWERTADGMPAKFIGEVHYWALPILGFLETSREKMTGPDIISADFNRSNVIFVFQVGAYLEKSTATGVQGEFLGLYVTEEEEEEEVRGEATGKVSPFCIRRAIWDRERDISEFREAKNMRAYIEGNGRIDSRIIFTTDQMNPEIAFLREEAPKMVRSGIPLQTVTRTEPRWNFILFELKIDSFVFSLSYSLYQEENITIEKWIEQWQRTFAEVDYSGGILTDKGCFISYPRSLMEALDKFPQQSFDDFRKKKHGR